MDPKVTAEQAEVEGPKRRSAEERREDNLRFLKWMARIVLWFPVFLVLLWHAHAWELHRGAVPCAYKWGRLAELPVDRRDQDILVGGNAFTRRFEVTFTAPAESVSAWLAASPGIADAEVSSHRWGVTRYSIDPGGGAVFAEVEVSHSGTRVRIDVHWS